MGFLPRKWPLGGGTLVNGCIDSSSESLGVQEWSGARIDTAESTSEEGTEFVLY